MPQLSATDNASRYHLESETIVLSRIPDPEKWECLLCGYWWEEELATCIYCHSEKPSSEP